MWFLQAPTPKPWGIAVGLIHDPLYYPAKFGSFYLNGWNLLCVYTLAKQGLWRIEYLNTGRASSPNTVSPKMWALSLLPVVAN